MIYSKLPANKQILTLSATYPSYMAAYAARYMRSPTFIRLNIVDPSLRGIKQFYKIIASTAGSGGFQAKIGSLMDCLSRIEFHQAIVFTNYQLKYHDVNRIFPNLASSAPPNLGSVRSCLQAPRTFAPGSIRADSQPSALLAAWINRSGTRPSTSSSSSNAVFWSPLTW